MKWNKCSTIFYISFLLVKGETGEKRGGGEEGRREVSLSFNGSTFAKSTEQSLLFELLDVGSSKPTSSQYSYFIFFFEQNLKKQRKTKKRINRN